MCNFFSVGSYMYDIENCYSKLLKYTPKQIRITNDVI
jgi:hypothetical protein